MSTGRLRRGSGYLFLDEYRFKEQTVIQIIIALGVAVWFFRSACATGRNALGWAAIGALAVFAPSVPWAVVVSLVVLPAVIGSDMGDTQTFLLAAFVGLIGVGIGCVLAWWLHRRYLRGSAHNTEGSSAKT